MKRWIWLALVPLAAFAGVREDYAQQWPLALSSADAGAYRVTLTAPVYQQLQSPQAKDVVVANADGTPAAASLFRADQPLAQPAPVVDVPWFPLPYAGSSLSRDVAAISEIATDGSLRRVELRPGQVAADGGASEYLIDTSRLRQPVTALQVDWAPEQAPFELSFLVAASDDLRNWRDVQDEARLIDLQNNGQRLAEHRIVLYGPVQARYLRLVPRRKEQRALRLTAVRAETAAQAGAMDWQWRELAPERGVDEHGTEVFLYRLDGRFPAEVADVALPGNSTHHWRLASRDAEDAPWMPATAPWMSYRVDSAGKSSQSPPQPLHGAMRHRYWRLTPRDALAGEPPRLRLGYRLEVLVFLAEGRAPYSLLAGSARAQRSDAPLPQLVDALRAQRGPAWQPAEATPGQAQVLAGERALTPAPVQRDWKSWLLWALLVGGALIVAGFAFSLLREKRAD